jgi:hypothetical protein
MQDGSMENQHETMSSESGRSVGKAKTATDPQRGSIERVGLLNSRENAR